MLQTLRIQNFAIIENVEIEFGQGLNIFSGETGAGKSIIMDALNIILGGRASPSLIRAGASCASVEVLFEVTDKSTLKDLRENIGIDIEGEDLIVRRVIQPQGRSRAYVNNAMINIQTLGRITSKFVDLCSQGDQQLLTKPEEQLLWLDRYGGLLSLRAVVKEKFGVWQQKLDELKKLELHSTKHQQHLDFLRFQLKELSEANLEDPWEDDKVKQELEILSNHEALLAFAKESEALICGDDSSNGPSILDSLGGLTQKAERLIKTDPKLAQAHELMNSLKLTLEEAGYFFRDYTKQVVFDESKIDELNTRYSALNQLKRKYGPTLKEAISLKKSLETKLKSLENIDDSLKSARAALNEALDEFEIMAKKLGKERAARATVFSKEVEKQLAELNMAEAVFSVKMDMLEAPSSSGTDGVKYLIAPNPGEQAQAIQKVASGGELSRIMLALHHVLSAKDGIRVYLFDEVDAGIGGKTATIVGKKLQQVASNNQVICITHLPQVACFARRHFRVEKSVHKKSNKTRTVCSVVQMKKEDRVFEIARMLGGMEKDTKALANAKAMLTRGQYMP